MGHNKYDKILDFFRSISCHFGSVKLIWKKNPQICSILAQIWHPWIPGPDLLSNSTNYRNWGKLNWVLCALRPKIHKTQPTDVRITLSGSLSVNCGQEEWEGGMLVFSIFHRAWLPAWLVPRDVTNTCLCDVTSVLHTILVLRQLAHGSMTVTSHPDLIPGTAQPTCVIATGRLFGSQFGWNSKGVSEMGFMFARYVWSMMYNT